MLDSAVATVQDLSRKGADTVVTVKVTGVSKGSLRGIPSIIASTRARARALVAAGALPSGVETIRDVTAGDIERLTSVESVKERGSGTVVDKIYTVRVNA